MRLNNRIGPENNKPSKQSKSVSILACLSLLAGIQVATQYMASLFHYSDALGASFHHVYWPWSIVIWWFKWQGMYLDSFRAAITVGMAVISSGFIICLFLKTLLTHSSKSNPYLHGSAQWATKETIVKAGLLNNSGVYVGAWEDDKGLVHYLRHNGPEHVLTFAPTRSGKGVGLVLPTLLSWPHSVFITDLKGELWASTAGWRQQYAANKVIRFEPAISIGSARWNPLDEIRLGTDFEVGDAQNLATIIVDPDGKGLVDHWQKTAQPLLVGLILHVLYQALHHDRVASLPLIDGLISNPDSTISEVLVEMKEFPHHQGKPHPVVSASAQDMIDRPEDEAGSIVSTLKSYLSLYRDPVVANNVSASDFHIRDLMNHDSPVSLYIITLPTDKDRLKPLVRVLINMIVRVLAGKVEFERLPVEQKPRRWAFNSFARLNQQVMQLRSKKTYKHRLLGMIDEFPALGKLDILQESLAFVGGYGIKFYLICQDINQLKSREKGYGSDETITSNCHIQNAFPPNRLETAEHLSKLTGQTTVIKEQITTSGQRMGMFLKQVSKTYQEVQRPLLTADECLRMPGSQKKGDLIEKAGAMLVYVNNIAMIYGRQPLYFTDDIFMARAAIPEPVETDRLYGFCIEKEDVTL